MRQVRRGIDASKLTKGDGKKKRRHKPDDGEDAMPVGGLRPGAQVSDDSDSEYGFSHYAVYMLLKEELSFRDPEDKAAKMRRAVRANNFTQQTNALDVDKHMYVLGYPQHFHLRKLRLTRPRRMAYIEENMKLRSGRPQESALDADAGTSTSTGKEPTTAIANTTAGSKAVGNNKDDDPFDHLDPRYKVERKLGEEGSVTNSLAMLTAIPEVDLGMEYVAVTLYHISFFLFKLINAIGMVARD